MPAMRGLPHTRALAVAGLLLLTGSLAAGCRPNREAAANREPAPPKPLSNNVAPVDIVYELTGGFAGFDLTLSLRREAEGAPDGEMVVVEKGETRRPDPLSPEEWVGLEALLQAANLEQLRPSYGREGAVSDAMHEVVTVRRGGNEVRVAAISDPADEPPAEFRVLTERLRELAITSRSR